jgi:hypothetical protein
MISGGVFSHVKHILLALEKNAFLSHSKPLSHSMEPSPHQSRLPTGITHWHWRKEEDPHLHTGDREKSKT